MADDNVFGQFSNGVTSLSISDSADGARGFTGEGISRVGRNDSILEKSINSYSAELLNNKFADLSKGIGSLKALAVVFCAEGGIVHGIDPRLLKQVSKMANQNIMTGK